MHILPAVTGSLHIFLLALIKRNIRSNLLVYDKTNKITWQSYEAREFLVTKFLAKETLSKCERHVSGKNTVAKKSNTTTNLF